MDEKQLNDCADLLTSLQIKTLENVVKIADKYNIERDDLVMKFAAMFGAMAELSTFKDYEIKEDK